ncbi:MAG: hypothetical protein QNK11_08910 [Legionella sp.]|nr:hypothetical protein [Legionella sp.]
MLFQDKIQKIREEIASIASELDDLNALETSIGKKLIAGSSLVIAADGTPLTKANLHNRIEQLAVELATKYNLISTSDAPVLIRLSDGATAFFARLKSALARQDLYCTEDKLEVIKRDDDTNREQFSIHGEIGRKHVILVAELIETEQMLEEIKQYLVEKGPQSLDSIVLLNQQGISGYTGFEVNESVGFKSGKEPFIGLGFDYLGFARDLLDGDIRVLDLSTLPTEEEQQQLALIPAKNASLRALIAEEKKLLQDELELNTAIRNLGRSLGGFLKETVVGNQPPQENLGAAAEKGLN